MTKLFTKEFYGNIQGLSDEGYALITRAEEYARKNMPSDDVHGIGHIERVVINTKKIWENEGGNPIVLFFSAWLHDIGRSKEFELKKNHALISSEITQDFVQKEHLNLEPNALRKILESIEAHSFSSGKSQDCLESKILSDADKLDALGGIGIYRASVYQNKNGTGIDGLFKHFNNKLLSLDGRMNTKTGKEMALKRQEFMHSFIDTLNLELK